MNEPKSKTPMQKSLETQDLERKLDELRLQAHLFSKDMKNKWESAERDWKTIKSHLKHMKPQMKQAVDEGKQVVMPLISNLKSTLADIQAELKSHRPRT